MSKTLQDKIRWLLGISVTALILISLIGGVVVYRLMGEVGNEAVRGTQTTIALNREMDDAQMSFRSQVQEWKDLLLRGRDPQLFQKHYRAFHDRHDEVCAGLTQLAADLARNGFNTAQVTQIQQAHIALLARYESALAQFTLANKPDNYLKVDELVRGIDRKLAADMELLDYAIEQQVLEQAGSINDKVQGRHLWQLSFVLAIMLALFPLVGLISFGAIGRMTRRIQEEKERLHVTLQSIGDAVVVTDPAGAVEYLNPVAEAMTGWALDEARGKPLPEIFNIVNEDTRKAVENPVEIVLREGHVVGLANHTVLIARNGGECAIEDSASPVRDMDGKLCGVVMVFQDATKQRQASRMLRESEERLRMTLRCSPDTVFICEQDGRIVYVNDNAVGTLGYSRDELTRKTVFDLVPADWREPYRQEAKQIVSADNEHHIFEIYLVKKDGRKIPMELNAVLLPNGRVYGSCRDITERKQMKQALQQQLAYSRALNQISETLMKSEEPALILEETTRIVGETLGADRSLIYDISFKQQLIIGLSEWLNPQHPDISATKGTYPLSVFIGGASAMQSTKTWFSSQADAVNPNLIADGSGEILHHQMKIKSLLWYSFAFTQDGYYLLVLNQVCAKKEWTQVEIDFLDSVSYIVNVELEKIRLLDERKRAEADLRIAATAFESHAGILVADANGLILRVNRAFTDITGYTAEEVIGKNPKMLKSGRHDANFYAVMWESLNRTGAWRGEIWNRRKNGEIYPEYLTITAVKNKDGNTANYVASLADITERKRAEAQKQKQLEELEAIYLLSDAASGAGSLEQVYEAAKRSILGALKADRVSILLFDAEGVMRFVSWQGLSDAYRKAADGHSPWTRDAVEPEPILVDDIELDADWAHFRPVAAAEGIRAFGFVPLVQHGCLLGKFMIYFNRSHHFTGSEVQLAKTIASHISFAIEHTRAEKALRESEEHTRLLLDSAAEGVYGVDTHGNCTFVNAAFLRILGYRDADELIGKNIHELIHHSHADGTPYLSEDCHIYHAYQRNEKMHVDDEVFWRRDGSAFAVEYWSFPIIRDGQVVGAVATFFDITQRKQNEEEIYNLAFYDPLTRLPNRRLLMDRLGHTMASGARSVEYAALMFIDLDNFKTINDTLGHDVGDLLLIETARRLQDCVREGDTVARLGGDEFVVMLEGLSAEVEQAATQSEVVGQKIRASLNQPYLLKDFQHHSSSSIGIGLFHGRDVTVDELLKRADMAMYEAKTSGRNALRFFDPAMQTNLETRSTLEIDLRRAVSGQEQLLLYYQAQVDTSGRLTGAEALVRWMHPGHGMVSPADFIPIAEETGLILPLGLWVMETACRQLVAWAAQPETAHLTLAVNVSAKQFRQPIFVGEVLALVDYFGIDPAKLKLEITESLLLDNVADIIAKMTALKARGINFSMDDFGTGYSSLSYLKRLPLYQLKIDQSFVRDVLTDHNDAAIAKMIVALAKSMNLAVIAEGVETEAQRAFLELNGCHDFQGYLFSKPVPVKEFEKLIAQW